MGVRTLLYSVHELAKIYTRGFYKFLENYNIGICSNNARQLFSYAMNSLCGLEVIDYNLEIENYGSKCVKYLSHLKGVPKNLASLTLEEKANLVSCCNVYLVVGEELSKCLEGGE